MKMNRRDFITATTVGVALGSTWHPTASAEAAQAANPLAGTGIKPKGVSRLLYVCDDANKRTAVYDTDDGHKLVRSIPWVGEFQTKGRPAFDAGLGEEIYANSGELFINKTAGICAHPATNAFTVTHRGLHYIVAYDVVTGKVAWSIPNTEKAWGHKAPDRQVQTADGHAIFVPMRSNPGETGKNADWFKHVNVVLDAKNGNLLDTVIRPAGPHNNWMGEAGKYAYLGGWLDQTLILADQTTHKVAKKIGPFNWSIRQMVTDPDERYVYLTLNRTQGMGVGDVTAGKVLDDALVQVPKERTKNWNASASGGGLGRLPHGQTPWSHGIGMRPGGSNDVYILDNEWGYLYVFDTKKDPAHPKVKGYIPLFTNIEEPWDNIDDSRWISFSIDGKWCYPADGTVVDCEAGKVANVKVARSEKVLVCEFLDGKFVHVSGQQGGVYPKRA